MALLPLGVSSVWGGRVPPSRARYNAIDTHGNREGQNVSSVSPCDLRKKLLLWGEEKTKSDGGGGGLPKAVWLIWKEHSLRQFELES